MPRKKKVIETVSEELVADEIEGGVEEIQEIEEAPVVKQVEVKKEPVRYLECHFCQNKQYETNSQDPTSAWCGKCGKCFELVWLTE